MQQYSGVSVHQGICVESIRIGWEFMLSKPKVEEIEGSETVVRKYKCGEKGTDYLLPVLLPVNCSCTDKYVSANKGSQTVKFLASLFTWASCSVSYNSSNSSLCIGVCLLYSSVRLNSPQKHKKYKCIHTERDRGETVEAQDSVATESIVELPLEPFFFFFSSCFVHLLVWKQRNVVVLLFPLIPHFASFEAQSLIFQTNETS